jgi:predicted alpha/beta hydrolase family esterase
MPQVLFIHSAGPQSEIEGSGPMLAALRRTLGSALEIVAPDMPGTDDPEAAQWDAAAGTAIAEMKQPYALLGHSLGASTILKCLATNDPPPGLVGVVLVSAPFWGRQMPDFALPDGFGKRLERVPNLLFITSRDDEVAPPEHAKKYVDAIPGATLKLVDGHGHEFARGSIEPVAQALRELFD